MELKSKIEKSQEILNSIYEKCWESENFKKELIVNPEKTIEKFTEGRFKLSQNDKLKVIDQTDDRFIFLNIPRKPNFDNLQLTDEQLEIVSGGYWWLAVAAYYFVGGMVAEENAENPIY